MHSGDSLLLAGASVRAAAFAAFRAGLQPWCIDHFADADLHMRCPSAALPAEQYPVGFSEALAAGPPGPWMYTGALENRPALVAKISRQRPLWGNEAAVLERVRSPLAVAEVLAARVLPCPLVASRPTSQRRWLRKPLAGAGGRGIRFATLSDQGLAEPTRWYFQEFIEGEACAAVYLGDGRQAQFLGLTRQLVGKDWLHAGPFGYCGSVGPLVVEHSTAEKLAMLGTALVEGFCLRGLFGVDCIFQDGVPFPVEVNPRYTASMELWDFILGMPLLAQHRCVFEGDAPAPPVSRLSSCKVFGKAVLFARQAFTFPEHGPWTASLQAAADIWALPEFADIPRAGTRIEVGSPVLTIFAQADSMKTCLEALQQIAADLEGSLNC
jgi:predicted ATP-grasp superfamily ATP-dependent carboligase